ncbi:hypothetical protein [Kitasatospora fiedleri]|uniref:hypothetical protein n=1 Tax=Kitasatospora fiedleri TaxID=2991545 RepID=UPI00249BEFC9|nr:hypothetical protein [Kitasatospora fiedleri]
MDIDLEPARGITGFPLGMAAEDLKTAAAALGRVKVKDEGLAGRFAYMKVTALHEQFEIVFHLEDGRTLTAAEVWAPRPGPERITVRLGGTDVFAVPARQLLDELRAAGHTVVDRTQHAYVTDLPLGLTRTAGHDVPLDTDGQPLHFQAALVASPGYYDFLLPAAE